MRTSKRTKPLNAYVLFFIISGTQLGDPAQNFQRNVYIAAGHDAWVCMILNGLLVSAALYAMIKTMEYYPDNDLYQIHQELFGRWLGKLFNFAFVLYFFVLCFTVLHSYAEVVHTWLFPDMNSWLFNTLMSLLFLYGVTGGIQVVAGFAVVSFILWLWVFLLYYFPWKYAQVDQLLPLFEAGPGQIINGMRAATYPMLGYELVYFLYPFIRDKQNVQKYSQLAIGFTIFTYCTLLINAIVFYAGEQLKHTVWATYSWYKIAQIPFVERFEIVGAAYWMILVLPNNLVLLWASTRGVRSVFKLKQKYALYACCLIFVLSSELLFTHEDVEWLSNLLGEIGIYLVWLYPIALFAFVRWKRGRGRKKGAGA